MNQTFTKNNPFISVIVPNFNGEKYLNDTINSVMNQSYSNWELIIVDDGSTDKSEKIAHEYLSDKITFIKRPLDLPKGGNVCRNIGIQKSKGEYIIFLDSDDLLADFCLQQRAEIIQKNPHLDFVVFNMLWFKEQPTDGKIFTSLQTQNPLQHFLVLDCIWQTTAPIWKKEFLNKINGFSENYSRLQDPEMVTRALLYPNVKYLLIPYSKADAYYRISQEYSIKKKWIGYEAMYQYVNDYYFPYNNLYSTFSKLYLAIFISFMHYSSAREENISQYKQTMKSILNSNCHKNLLYYLFKIINYNYNITKIARKKPFSKIINYLFNSYKKRVSRLIG